MIANVSSAIEVTSALANHQTEVRADTVHPDHTGAVHTMPMPPGTTANREANSTKWSILGAVLLHHFRKSDYC